jgi:hemolysin III
MIDDTTPSAPALDPEVDSSSMSSSAVPLARPLLRGWLHALMTPVAVLGAYVLWQSVTADAADPAARWSVGVFGLTFIGLYAISSLYHVPRWSARARYVLSRCDVAMIQLFIAGTFTPIAFNLLDGGWRMWSLVVAWAIAIIGAIVAASPLKAPRWVGTAGYIAVGWLAVVPLTQIISALPWEGMGLIALGGLLYTLGGVVYAKRWPDPYPRWFGFHEVFHLLVIAASICHYLAIWRYVLPVSG